MMASQLIVVTGMHRSGTSVLARAVQTLGASLGDNLMPGNAYNERGYFENNRLVQLNDAILLACERNWKSIPGIPASELRTSDKLRALRVDAIEFLTDFTAKHPAPALKDPRICRLLPFWAGVFEAADITPVFAVSLRYPSAVADSLNQRDHMSVRDSYDLWHAYNADLLHNLDPDWNVSFIDYRRMLDQPMRELARLSRLTGLSISDIPVSDIQAFIQDFLHLELNHAKRWEPLPPGQISELWAALSHMAVC